MLINVHHLKFQCIHFEYLEPCIYMHNIRVKKITIQLLKYLSVVQTKYGKFLMHAYMCIYKYRKIITWYTVWYTVWMNDQSSCVLFCSLPSQNNCYCNIMYAGKKREHGQWIILNSYPCWALIVLIKQSRWTMRQLRETFYLCQQVACNQPQNSKLSQIQLTKGYYITWDRFWGENYSTS